MKQKKQVHHSRPHSAENFAAKQRATRQVLVQATCDTYSQYVFDMACLTLNEEFGFGKERLQRFHAELSKRQAEYQDALDTGPESGYMQTVLDRRLAQILGEIKPFETRYEWLKEII
ncbi:MAG: hypothetical protein LUF68_04295 [Clostridiales bacterium]|nr:hypothetical protein [Clostridiales bacterium]